MDATREHHTFEHVAHRTITWDDPYLHQDRLPQPFRFIRGLVNDLVNRALQSVIDKNYSKAHSLTIDLASYTTIDKSTLCFENETNDNLIDQCHIVREDHSLLFSVSDTGLVYVSECSGSLFRPMACLQATTINNATILDDATSSTSKLSKKSRSKIQDFVENGAVVGIAAVELNPLLYSKPNLLDNVEKQKSSKLVSSSSSSKIISTLSADIIRLFVSTTSQIFVVDINTRSSPLQACDWTVNHRAILNASSVSFDFAPQLSSTSSASASATTQTSMSYEYGRIVTSPEGQYLSVLNTCSDCSGMTSECVLIYSMPDMLVEDDTCANDNNNGDNLVTVTCTTDDAQQRKIAAAIADGYVCLTSRTINQKNNTDIIPLLTVSKPIVSMYNSTLVSMPLMSFVQSLRPRSIGETAIYETTDCLVAWSGDCLVARYSLKSISSSLLKTYQDKVNDYLLHSTSEQLAQALKDRFAALSTGLVGEMNKNDKKQKKNIPTGNEGQVPDLKKTKVVKAHSTNNGYVNLSANVTYYCTHAVSCIALDASHTMMSVGLFDGTVLLYNLITNTIYAISQYFVKHNDAVKNLAFFQNRYLLSCGGPLDRSLHVYDLSTLNNTVLDYSAKVCVRSSLLPTNILFSSFMQLINPAVPIVVVGVKNTASNTSTYLCYDLLSASLICSSEPSMSAVANINANIINAQLVVCHKSSSTTSSNDALVYASYSLYDIICKSYPIIGSMCINNSSLDKQGLALSLFMASSHTQRSNMQTMNDIQQHLKYSQNSQTFSLGHWKKDIVKQKSSNKGKRHLRGSSRDSNSTSGRFVSGSPSMQSMKTKLSAASLQSSNTNTEGFDNYDPMAMHVTVSQHIYNQLTYREKSEADRKRQWKSRKLEISDLLREREEMERI